MKTADWSHMLAQLTTALEQSAAEVARHEQALASPLLTSDLSDERHTSWQRALERFGQRLQDCQTRVEQAERQTQDAETDLAAQEEVTRQFQTQLQQIRQRLANLPTSPVE